MTTHTASRIISASPENVFSAFTTSDCLEQWLPPGGMAGKILYFDFRNGGSYRMRLSYNNVTQATGKTTRDSDEFEVRFIRIQEPRLIEQEVNFKSSDSAYSGTMRMVWTFQAGPDGTLVTIKAENVPFGISAIDHETGMKSSLNNLADFIQKQNNNTTTTGMNPGLAFRLMRRKTLIQSIKLWLTTTCVLAVWMFSYHMLGGHSGMIFMTGVFIILLITLLLSIKIEKQVICPVCGHSLADIDGWNIFEKQCPHCNVSFKK